MKKLYIVFILLFIQGLIHNLGHPITPDYVTGLGIEKYMFGVFFALMSLGLTIGGPIWGRLGDYHQRPLLILIGLSIYSIGQFTFGNVHNIYIMALARLVSGLGVSASVTLLITYVIDCSKHENRMKNLGYAAALIALGASISYLIGGQLQELWYPIGEEFTEAMKNAIYTKTAGIIFLIQALLNLGFATTIYFVLEKDQNMVHEHKPSIIEGFKHVRTLSVNLNIFLISLTFISIAAINVSKYSEVFLSDRGYGSEGIGNFVFVTGIVGLATTLFIVPLAAKVKKNLLLMLFINVASAAIIFFVFRMNNIIVGLYTLFMLYMIFKTVYAPLEQHYISSFGEAGKYGTIMGVRQSFFALGLVIGPIVGGFLYGIKPLYAFDFSVIMFLVGSLLLYIIGRNVKKELREQL